MKKVLIEVCCYSVESAVAAQTGGASRIELCDNMFEGGTTPSLGTIILARKYLDIPLHVIIRPRGGDFCYSDIEFESMKIDIIKAKNNNVDGIVLGMLKNDGSIDIQRTQELIKIARPLSVTFHRAFDMCKDPFIALEELIELGVERILTSGQESRAVDGKVLLSELVKQARYRIIIMPGSGINDNNIKELLADTGAKEFHLSGKQAFPGKMKYKKPCINMGSLPGISEYDIWITDTKKINRIVQIAKNF